RLCRLSVHAARASARVRRPACETRDADRRAASPGVAVNWTVFVSDDEAHEFAHINLVRKVPRRYQPGDGFLARIDSPYMPLAQAIWVRRTRYGEVNAERGREAWNTEGLAFFRWFAV